MTDTPRPPMTQSEPVRMAAVDFVLAPGWAADRPSGPRTEKGHTLASSLRRRLPDVDIDYDEWVRDIEVEAAGLYAARSPVQPVLSGLDVLDAEIARRRSPGYQRMPKRPDAPPAERSGAAAANAMQHGELTGLVIAREIIRSATAPAAAHEYTTSGNGTVCCQLPPERHPATAPAADEGLRPYAVDVNASWSYDANGDVVYGHTLTEYLEALRAALANPATPKPYCVEGHPSYVAGCSNCDWKAGVR